MAKWRFIMIALALMLACKENERETPLNADVEVAMNMAQSVCQEQSMQWLRDILDLAEADRLSATPSANYLGFISLLTYEGNVLVFTKFMTHAEGFRLYECNGDAYNVPDSTDPSHFVHEGSSRENIIYANIPVN